MAYDIQQKDKLVILLIHSLKKYLGSQQNQERAEQQTSLPLCPSPEWPSYTDPSLAPRLIADLVRTLSPFGSKIISVLRIPTPHPVHHPETNEMEKNLRSVF